MCKWMVDMKNSWNWDKRMKGKRRERENKNVGKTKLEFRWISSQLHTHKWRETTVIKSSVLSGFESAKPTPSSSWQIIASKCCRNTCVRHSQANYEEKIENDITQFHYWRHRNNRFIYDFDNFNKFEWLVRRETLFIVAIRCQIRSLVRRINTHTNTLILSRHEFHGTD